MHNATYRACQAIIQLTMVARPLEKECNLEGKLQRNHITYYTVQHNIIIKNVYILHN